ncbi:MAG: glycosyltransferase N-terminal domain-containing protein [candidate division WOR-3 bacterium]|nr:glycosyltransferase [candidate division WOR-3 bacterium]MDW8150249.1 glycosyltransferase N-terminal domain-containing protein [candidate division WOR-3 bacterium]
MKVWFHCSSIGELNAISPLISRFEDTIISVFTKTGYEYAKKNFKNSIVFRYFLDNPFVLRKILSLKPKILIIAETEIWPNLINCSKKKGIKLFLVNARLSNRSFRLYRAFSFFFKNLIEKFDKIYTRSESDKLRFKMLGAKNLVFFGNIKVDAVSFNVKDIRREELGFSNDDFIITFGSVRSKEIKKILKVVEYYKDFKFIIAPRHLENIEKIVDELKHKNIDWSFRTKNNLSRVLILDSFGELKSIYKISDICFVGGTLENYGGHNILESLYFGKPTIIGSFYRNIKEQVEYFKSRNAIFIVKDENAMIEVIKLIRNNEKIREHVKLVCDEFFKNHIGATQRIYEDILESIKYS